MFEDKKDSHVGLIDHVFVSQSGKFQFSPLHGSNIFELDKISYELNLENPSTAVTHLLKVFRLTYPFARTFWPGGSPALKNCNPEKCSDHLRKSS